MEISHRLLLLLFNLSLLLLAELVNGSTDTQRKVFTRVYLSLTSVCLSFSVIFSFNFTVHAVIDEYILGYDEQ